MNGSKYHGLVGLRSYTGTMLHQSTYINDTLVGNKHFYNEGTFKSSNNLDTYTEYYPNGKVQESGECIQYSNYVSKEGEYQAYNDKGVLTESGIHQYNMKKEIVKYNRDGQVMKRIKYLPNGYYELYDTAGYKVEEGDDRQNYKRFDRQGRLIISNKYKNKTNHTTNYTYDENGEVVGTENYTNNKDKDGKINETSAKHGEANIEHLNVNDLKSLCKNKGIKGYSKLNRDELIDYIQRNDNLSHPSD